MSKKKKGLAKFLTGVAVGTGLGILFAPKKGSETREQLKSKLDELLVKAKSLKKEDVALSIENKIEEIKLELDDLERSMNLLFFFIENVNELTVF